MLTTNICNFLDCTNCVVLGGDQLRYPVALLQPARDRASSLHPGQWGVPHR